MVRDACAQLFCTVKEIVAVREQELVVAEILEFTALESLEPLIYDHDQLFTK